MSVRTLHLAIEDDYLGQRVVATCKMSLAQFEELTGDDAEAGANLLRNVRGLEATLDRTIALEKTQSDIS